MRVLCKSKLTMPSDALNTTSKLAQETRGCLKQLTTGDKDELQGRFVFPPGYLGFDGHFPGNPVLPGVCMVEAVLAMLESWSHHAVTLAEVQSAKWLKPVQPGVELSFKTEISTNSSKGPGTVIKARISSDGDKIAELLLRVTGMKKPKGDSR
jgi:3-hydroxymyristoyl/3-hydroxydecanoyl-(acyl carrier protein) dehydratase